MADKKIERFSACLFSQLSRGCKRMLRNFYRQRLCRRYRKLEDTGHRTRYSRPVNRYTCTDYIRHPRLSKQKDRFFYFAPLRAPQATLFLLLNKL